MFVHIGADVIIPIREIIAILNLDLIEKSDINADFYKMIDEEGFIKDISGGNRKSMIITDKTVYISGISPMTLKGRTDFPFDGIGLNK